MDETIIVNGFVGTGDNYHEFYLAFMNFSQVFKINETYSNHLLIIKPEIDGT